MYELELKFQVPPDRLAALQRAVATPTATTQRLQARYFDTPDRRLTAAALALRLRKEGQDWVQTLKGAGDGHLRRLEHEVRITVPRGGAPALDISRHAGTAVGDSLLAALGNAAASLMQVYDTDIRRTCRLLRGSGALVELALDIGEIRAGDARLPVCELELELKRGPVTALTTLATRWATRHGLWLDVRSKSERGDLLARALAANTPSLATTPALQPGLTPDAALRVMVGSCLAHALPNAAAVAGGCSGPEHLHQLRVALRRLRTALRVFGDWSPAVGADWTDGLALLFTRLGVARDRDMLIETVAPALTLMGSSAASVSTVAPATTTPAHWLPPVPPGPTPAQALCEPACTGLLLALIGFAHGEAPAAASPPAGDAAPESAAPPTSPTPLPALARERIRRLHRQLQRNAKSFANDDDEARHRARKRLKRLRYAVELTAALSRRKAVRRYLAQLRPAQEALGLYNDLCVAQALLREHPTPDPRIWFVLGWIAARREQLLARAQCAMVALVDLPRVP